MDRRITVKGRFTVIVVARGGISVPRRLGGYCLLILCNVGRGNIKLGTEPECEYKIEDV